MTICLVTAQSYNGLNADLDNKKANVLEKEGGQPRTEEMRSEKLRLKTNQGG